MIKGKLTQVDVEVMADFARERVVDSAESINAELHKARTTNPDAFNNPPDDFTITIRIKYVDERPSRLFDDPELLQDAKFERVTMPLGEALTDQNLVENIVAKINSISPTTILRVEAEPMIVPPVSTVEDDDEDEPVIVPPSTDKLLRENGIID